MNNAELDPEWQQIRFDILSNAATNPVPVGIENVWFELLALLSDAFGPTRPPYAVYRSLRTFAVVRWPDIISLLDRSNDIRICEPLLDEVIVILQKAVTASEKSESDALETELEFLATMLEQHFQ